MMVCQSGRFGVLGPNPDPFFSSISLLMGFEGTDGSTSFVDESSFAHTMSFDNQAQIDTAQFKFGGSSALFDGAQDSVLTGDNAAFEFASGEFTVETWARFANLSTTQGVIGKESDSTAGPTWGIYLSSSTIYFRIAGDSTGGSPTDVSATPSLGTGTWYHIAADRDASNVVRLYLNGVMIASATVTTNIPNAAGAMRLGAFPIGAFTRSLDGWLDEVRITKGVARYASDAGFAVPTKRFPRAGDYIETQTRVPAGDMQSGSDRRIPAGDMNSGSDVRITEEYIDG